MTDPREILAAKVNELKEQFLAQLPVFLLEIDSAWSGGCGRIDAQDHLQAAYRLLHRLSGSGGTLGLPEVSTAARAAELKVRGLIEQERAPDATERAAIASDLLVLRRVVAGMRGGEQPEPAQASETALAPKPAGGRRKRVLVVEDIAEQRDILIAALSSAGWDVSAASDGLDGIRAAFSDRPDLVISDVMMPGLSGYHLCRFLKSSPQHARTPIILLTALEEQLDRFWGGRCGADRFRAKSEGFGKLLADARTLLEAPAPAPEAGVSLNLARGLVGEQVAVLMDQLLRESTLRAEIAGLGRHAEQLPGFLDAALGLLGQLFSVDAVAISMQFDAACTAAAAGESETERERISCELHAALGEQAAAPIAKRIDWLSQAAGAQPAEALGDAMTARLGSPPTVLGSLGAWRRCGRPAFTAAEARLFAQFAEQLSDIAAVAWSNEAITRKNRELLELHAMKDRLSELLVHDVKNAAWSVALTIDLLAANPSSSESLRRVLGRAQQGCKLLMDMVVNLLDIAKMEEAAVTLRPGPIDLAGLAREIVSLNRDVAAKRGLELAVGELPAAYGDADFVRRVLSNLVANAVKHTARGRVAIDSEPARQAGAAAHQLVVSVRDTGDGIPATLQERLFHKFTQSEERRPGADQAEGLPVDRGLGLYFCRLAIEAHGGRIWVESVPGAGSAFRFTVPVDEASFRLLQQERARAAVA